MTNEAQGFEDRFVLVAKESPYELRRHEKPGESLIKGLMDLNNLRYFLEFQKKEESLNKED